MSDRIEVVSAAMLRKCEDGNARVLLGQRKPGGSYPYLWCTPGGKREAGEGAPNALARELREEVGLLDSRAVFEHWRDGRSPVYEHDMISSTTGRAARVTCIAFYAPRAFEALTLDGLMGVGWFTSFEVRHLKLAPADDANRLALLDLLAVV